MKRDHWKPSERQARIEYLRQKQWGICSCADHTKADVKRWGTCISGSCPHAWKPGTYAATKSAKGTHPAPTRDE